MVTWKDLGEVCKIIRGTRITKGELVENGKYPVISGGVTPMGYIDNYNREPDTITVSQYGTAGYVDFQKLRFWANDICYCIYPERDLDNKYLWYVLKSMQNFLYAIRNTDAIPYSLPAQKLNSVSIPIPSLTEQHRIVDILDTFTSSIDNLKQQIAQRRKQYEYYRDQLLDLEGKEGVEIKKLGDSVISLKTGLNPRKNFVLNTPDSDIPYITGKDIYNNIINVTNKTDKINKSALLLINKRACLEKGILLFASTGTGTVGRMAIVEEYNNDWGMSETLYGIKMKSGILPKYIMYCLYSNIIRKQFEPKISKGSVPHLKVVDLLNVVIKIPVLSEQQRIVNMLDKFEASIQNLEAQLSQREKQYEYYRNKLLTFE